MTPTELRACLAALGWSQSRAARELEIPNRLFRYYCSGQEPIPRVVELAIRSGVVISTLWERP